MRLTQGQRDYAIQCARGDRPPYATEEGLRAHMEALYIQHAYTYDTGKPASMIQTDLVLDLLDERAALTARAEQAENELRNIAEANPAKWDEEVRDQFQEWAQSRARFALQRAKGGA